MPAKTAKRELAAEVITGYFEDASDAKAERMDVLWDAYRRTDPSYVPDDVPSPRIKSPYLYAVLNTKLAWLVRAIKANGRWVIAHPTSPEYRDAGPIVTQAIHGQFTNRPLRNEATILSGLGQGFKYGDHTWLLEWHEDGAGHWGVRILNVNINDVFPDPWEQRYVILRRFVTVRELQKIAETLSAPVYEKDDNGDIVYDPYTGEPVPMVGENGKPLLRDGGVAQAALKEVVKCIDDGHMFERYGLYWDQHKNTFPTRIGRYSGDDTLSSGGSSNVGADKDPLNARVCVLEYHETANDGVTCRIIPDNPKHPERKSLMLQDAAPHAYGRCQLVRWTPYPVDDEAFGYCLSEIVGLLADLNDFAMRASARRILRYADPAIKYRRSAKINTMYLRTQSNVAIPVQNMDDLEYMDPPAGGDMHQLLHAISEQSMDKGLQEGGLRRGETGTTNTATEASIAEQGGASGDFLVATRAFMTICDMADVILRILRVHVTAPKLIPFLGPRTAKMVELMPDALAHNYWIEIGGAVMGGNPNARLTNLMSIYTQMGASGAMDPLAVAEAALKETGFVYADEFLAIKRGPPPIPPELEHHMLAQRMPIMVSAQDDHEEHLRKHGAERLLIQSGMRIVDALYFERLMRHEAEHAAAFQMQQQMQMAGGGPGPMAEPMRPSDAGQPGQPKTYGPATAGVNEDRQAPNQGRAPQPAMAPGRPSFVRREAPTP